MNHFDQLVHRAIDDSLTAAEMAELKRLVCSNSEFRKRYVQFVSLHANLPVALEQIAVDPPIEVKPARSPRLVLLLTALAACIALAVGLAVWNRSTAPIATLVDTKSCRWDSGTLPTAAGSSLGQGRLRLVEGIAVLVFTSGAELTIEGPADIELKSPMECVLHAGQLAAKMPPTAHGFTVQTPTSVLTDLGTEFGVKVHPGRMSDVQVFSGRVDVVHRATGQTESMKTGNRSRFTTDQVQPLTVQESQRNNDSTKTKPTIGTRTIHLSTAMGRGKDAFVMAMETIPDDRQSDSLLLMKKNKQSMFRWDRMAYLGFDLALLPRRPILDSELTVTFAPTGMGYASLVPDATFSVYGVTDFTLNNWDEGQIDWATAPANVPVEGLDQSKLVKLGSFVMPQGVQTGNQTISGPSLTEFLNRHPQSIGTIIICRETIGRDGMDLVHGIASRRHPTLNPPTLRITVSEIP